MKNLFLLFTMITFNVISAQMPSSTESRNSTFQRYDLFDSSGTLIGYKKYNETFNRWESFDLRTKYSSINSNSDNYTKSTTRNRSVPDLEYPSISSSDIEYAKILAQNRVSSELAERDRIAKYNESVIQSKYEELFGKINGFDISELEKTGFQDKFIEKLNIAHKTFIDVSDPERAKAKSRYIVQSYNELLEKYVNGPNRKKIDDLTNPFVSKTVAAIMNEGSSKQRNKDYSGAIRMYSYLFENIKKLSLDANDEFAVLFRLVTNYIAIGDYEDANYCNLIIKRKFPKDKIDFLENNAEIKYFTGSYSESLQSIAEALVMYDTKFDNIMQNLDMAGKRASGDQARLLIIRGKININKGQAASSCKDFNEGLKFDSTKEVANKLINKYCSKK